MRANPTAAATPSTAGRPEAACIAGPNGAIPAQPSTIAEALSSDAADLARPLRVVLEIEHRNPTGADARAVAGKAVAGNDLLDHGHRDRQRGDDRKRPAIEHRAVIRGLTNSDDRKMRGRTGFGQSDIIEAGEDDRIEAVVRSPLSRSDNARGGGDTICLPLNGRGRADVCAPDNFDVRGCGGAGGVHDPLGHAGGRVWVKDENPHQTMPLPASEARRARRRFARIPKARNVPTITNENAVVSVPNA